MNGVLIFHNILWSHYKGKVLSELYKLCVTKSVDLFVVQYALTESQRRTIGAIDLGLHEYPYRLMFDGSYDRISSWQKIHISLKELRRNDPEVVVLPGYWDISHWVLLFVCKIQRRKVILSVDSTEIDRPRYRIKELIKRIFVANCDGGFTYGQRSMQYLLRLGMPAEKITIRCQAAANEEIRSEFENSKPARSKLIRELGLGERNFCFVGRLSPEKNISCLIRAFAMLTRANDQAQNWGLLIVGDGPERDSLVSLSNREGLSHIRFAGGRAWREVPRLLAACDVFVLPSLSEPWGLVVNEAMVCGLPVLVSEACGCAADLIVDNQTGFAFDPTSPSQLQQRMDHFVRFPGEIRRIGAAAEKLISEFSPGAAASQMLFGIERLLKAHSSARLGSSASRR